MLITFSPFHTIFSKGFLFRVVETQDRVVRVKPLQNFRLSKIQIPFNGKVQNIEGKAETVDYQYFLHFPTIFPKGFLRSLTHGTVM